MHKSFTIKASKLKIISVGKGSIDFLLADEYGEKRIVSAIAKLNLNKKVISIQAVYERETPLVEALEKGSINDVIEVDFTGFNKLHPRVTNGHIQRASRGFRKAIDFSSMMSSQEGKSFSFEKPQMMVVLLSLLVLMFLAKAFL